MFYYSTVLQKQGENMITTKELGYVSSWATKVPYPGIEYSEQAVEKLVDAFNNFNKYYSNKEYDIILSNGEQILFEILEKIYAIC